MRKLVILLVAALLAIGAAMILAQDEPRREARPVTGSSGPAAPEASVLSLSPEERALQAVLEEGRVQVSVLVDQLAGTSDSDLRGDIERQIHEVKKQTRIRFLETKAAFARQRGDDEVEREARKLIDLILHPPEQATEPILQAPDKERTEQGGQP